MGKKLTKNISVTSSLGSELVLGIGDGHDVTVQMRSDTDWEIWWTQDAPVKVTEEVEGEVTLDVRGDRIMALLTSDGEPCVHVWVNEGLVAKLRPIH